VRGGIPLDELLATHAAGDARLDRGVFPWSLSEQSDTSTAAGRLLYHVVGAVAEFECEVIKARIVAGMKVSSSELVGRPSRPLSWLFTGDAASYHHSATRGTSREDSSLRARTNVNHSMQSKAGLARRVQHAIVQGPRVASENVRCAPHRCVHRSGGIDCWVTSKTTGSRIVGSQRSKVSSRAFLSVADERVDAFDRGSGCRCCVVRRESSYQSFPYAES
jgi:hypothetical protein